MAGWHHQLNGQEFEQASGAGDGQGSLACCSPWVSRAGHDWMTELNLLLSFRPVPGHSFSSKTISQQSGNSGWAVKLWNQRFSGYWLEGFLGFGRLKMGRSGRGNINFIGLLTGHGFRGRHEKERREKEWEIIFKMETAICQKPISSYLPYAIY